MNNIINPYLEAFNDGYGDTIFLEDYTEFITQVFEAYGSEVITEADDSKNQSTEEKRSMWQKICDFISKVINKIKEMISHFIDWITNKIVSNDKFIAKYKNATLGSIEVEAYDYEAGFKRLTDSYNTAQETFNIAHKAVKEFIETESNRSMDKDGLSEKLDEVQKEFDRIASKIGDAGKIKAYMAGRKHEQNVRDKYKNSLLGPKTKRTLDGKKLLAILEANKDIKNTMQKIGVKFTESLQYGYKSAKARQNDILFGEYFYYRRTLLMVICQRCSHFSSSILQAAQTLIIDLRKNIAACAKQPESE